MIISLPYGGTPYPCEIDDREVRVLAPSAMPPPPALDNLLDLALGNPIDRPALSTLVTAGSRVTVVISDPSRNEPRSAFLAAVRRHLPDVRYTVAVATGTHGPCRLDQLGVSSALLDGAIVVNHDGHRDDDLVTIGVTTRGTPVRVHRCVLEADLVVATGCIRPHYFAGFGAGVKAIFPGLGAAAAIRTNHQLKTLEGARAGNVDGNPCRDDLEEAVGLVPTPTFLINGICGPDGGIHGVVTGDPVTAFRIGAARARPWFTVGAAPAPLVIASDALPVTASLYQAAKIAVAVAPLVTAGGTIAVVAECLDGVDPLDVVNEAIFRIGVLPRLPAGARLTLVSSLSRKVTETTLLGYAPSVSSIVAETSGPIIVVPHAAHLICERIS